MAKGGVTGSKVINDQYCETNVLVERLRAIADSHKAQVCHVREFAPDSHQID
jgi:hypothetical protein